MTPRNVMVFGIGSFAHATMQILKEHGANVSCYLTRNYGHYGPSLEGPTYTKSSIANPVPLVKNKEIDLIIPMSIDWHLQPWTQELIATGIPIFCPTGKALDIERQRDVSRQLCNQYNIPFPKSHFVSSLEEAQKVIKEDPRPYVIKNPLCSPTSPIHTIVCESVEETSIWLSRLDFSEGVFLQEYVGRAEVGHIAVVSNGEVQSLVTNQEYKRAFHQNMGVVTGAPMGGLVQKDPDDQYNLAKELLYPLRPWFEKTNFHGPIQVTAAKHKGRWHVLEYNVRWGITSTQGILRLLQNPLDVMFATATQQKVTPKFHSNTDYGASVTLAGHGYPYVTVEGPRLPVHVNGKPSCDVWWNEVCLDEKYGVVMTGHRIADVVAVGGSLKTCLTKIYQTLPNIRCLGSYYRTDIGQSLWPPGEI